MLIAFKNMVVIHKDTTQRVMTYETGYLREDETGNWVTIYDEDMDIIDGYNTRLFTATFMGKW